jgi:hypothetical protein
VKEKIKTEKKEGRGGGEEVSKWKTWSYGWSECVLLRLMCIVKQRNKRIKRKMENGTCIG